MHYYFECIFYSFLFSNVPYISVVDGSICDGVLYSILPNNNIPACTCKR